MTEFDYQENDRTYEFRHVKCLNFGENPHQNAGLYKREKNADFEILTGGELTYLNIVNISEALNIASEFFDVNAVVIVKMQPLAELRWANQFMMLTQKLLTVIL